MSDTNNSETTMDRTAESEERKERLAAEADERVKTGMHWRDWMFIADGMAVGQAKAMRMTGTNRPYGKAYQRAFADWLKDRAWANRHDKAARSNMLWCVDHKNEIDAWRERLGQNERDKLNHPTTVKRAFEAAHRDAPDPNAAKRETKAEALARENAELWDKIKKLERQVQTEGSLFDLRRDSVEAIVGCIAGSMPVGRFESMQRAMTKKLAALKAVEKSKTAKAG